MGRATKPKAAAKKAANRSKASAVPVKIQPGAIVECSLPHRAGRWQVVQLGASGVTISRRMQNLTTTVPLKSLTPVRS